MLILTLTFALAAAGAVQAQVPSAPSTPQRVAAGRDATTIRPAESSLIGTIERFDEAGRRLTLQTRDGHVAFVLAADATVRMGPRTLPLSELAKHHGRKAKVRYTLTGGRRTAHWVVVSSEPPRAAN